MSRGVTLQLIDEVDSPRGVSYHYIWFTAPRARPRSVTIEVLNIARHLALAAHRGRKGAELVAARFPDGPPAENWIVSVEGGLEQPDSGTRLDL
jgi:hypothetical protein